MKSTYSSLCVGMAISRVFRVTRPAPPRLERVWEHRNRGWDEFRFFKKNPNRVRGGIGFSYNLTRPEYEITTLPPIYKYLLPLLILGLLLSF